SVFGPDRESQKETRSLTVFLHSVEQRKAGYNPASTKEAAMKPLGLLALTGRRHVMKSSHITALAAAALLLCAAPSWATESTDEPAPPASLSDKVPLYTNLGSHHKRITTRVTATQQYFDQALRLVYGFNHAEAIRSFTRAAELDPTCAMCYWGIALAYGPHVNASMDKASGIAAYAA